MCQQFDVLAEQSPTNFVARCEHGTVHLGWTGSIWLLTTPELHSLTHHVTRPGWLPAVSEAPCATQRDAAGRTVLWSGDRALAFTSEGFAAFRALLLDAHARLSETPAREDRHYRHTLN